MRQESGFCGQKRRTNSQQFVETTEPMCIGTGSALVFCLPLLLAISASCRGQPRSNYAFYLPTDDVIANIRSGDADTSYNGLAHIVSGALRVCRASVFKCNVTSPLDRSYLLRISQAQSASSSRRLLQDDLDDKADAPSQAESVSMEQVMKLLKQQKEEILEKLSSKQAELRSS
jgi:hypothetical protein